MFPDVETMIMDICAPYVQDRVGTTTPTNLIDRLPFVRVNVTGGSDNTVTDVAMFTVDVFSRTRNEAMIISEQIRVALPKTHQVNGITLDHVRTVIKPSARPWDDDRIRRHMATYEAHTRAR